MGEIIEVDFSKKSIRDKVLDSDFVEELEHSFNRKRGYISIKEHQETIDNELTYLTNYSPNK